MHWLIFAVGLLRVSIWGLCLGMSIARRRFYATGAYTGICAASLVFAFFNAGADTPSWLVNTATYVSTPAAGLVALGIWTSMVPTHEWDMPRFLRRRRHKDR